MQTNIGAKTGRIKGFKRNATLLIKIQLSFACILANLCHNKNKKDVYWEGIGPGYRQ